MAFKLLIVFASLAVLSQATYSPNLLKSDDAVERVDIDIESIDRSGQSDVGAENLRFVNYRTHHDDGDSELSSELKVVTNPWGQSLLSGANRDRRNKDAGATAYDKNSKAGSYNRNVGIDRSKRIDNDSERRRNNLIASLGLERYGYGLPYGLYGKSGYCY